MARQIETDVVVVGGGGSGLAAAIEASGLARRVILLERSEKLGGSTAKSIGSITATNTPHQLRKGIRDCPDDPSKTWRDQRRVEESARSRLPEQDKPIRRFSSTMSRYLSLLMSLGGIRRTSAEAPHRSPDAQRAAEFGAYIYHLSARSQAGRRFVTSLRSTGCCGAGRVGVACARGQGRSITARAGLV